nr:probable inactive tRNA-specific adenosine deaminase-like protein 3 [Leptinotarsa decemlineata]XP_023019350.1 probable inactive tRNA-specific adenosine deaminase-like protein 3 [Leptinotarsa decemlineata]
MQNSKRLKLDESVMKRDYVKAKECLYPVLADDLIIDTPLTEVYVDSISNPKNTSKVIVELNSVLPLPEMLHLKRVKGQEVLLFPIEKTDRNSVHSILQQMNFDTTLLKNHVRTTSVAKVPPKTRLQYETAHKLWPCNFHSNKYLEKLATNTLFTADELQSHVLYMRVAIDVARHAKNIFFNGPQIGAVVVDPSINSVVAVGYQQTNRGPCYHAAMLAIDNVARTQNGGALSPEGPAKILGDLDLRGLPLELLEILQNRHPMIRFGATRFKTKEELVAPADGPYLCTGYCVYLTREPSVMCAMGLIHSRVKRVFYGARSSNGALGSLCKIHTVKDLNHHYEVWGGLLEEECCDL